jgi:hypothetical protein
MYRMYKGDLEIHMRSIHDRYKKRAHRYVTVLTR